RSYRIPQSLEVSLSNPVVRGPAPRHLPLKWKLPPQTPAISEPVWLISLSFMSFRDLGLTETQVELYQYRSSMMLPSNFTLLLAITE
ncbi:MAG: hypothetical protein AAGG51_18050, partial [Cyanobacteria bacterium P01_G01_bin.54]